MAYQPHTHEPPPAEPERNGLAGYAAIKYTAIIIIVLAIIFFLVWAITRFTS
jgi:flagellar biogenesis protein FliO